MIVISKICAAVCVPNHITMQIKSKLISTFNMPSIYACQMFYAYIIIQLEFTLPSMSYLNPHHTVIPRVMCSVCYLTRNLLFLHLDFMIYAEKVSLDVFLFKLNSSECESSKCRNVTMLNAFMHHCSKTISEMLGISLFAYILLCP